MSIESISVSSFMSTNVITETEDQTIQAVCRSMYENKIGSIVIVKTSMNNNNNNNSGHDIRSSDNTKNKQQRQPVGIITERDVVRILGSLQPALLKVPIRDLMSKPVITITPSRSIKDAMQTMQLKNIRRLVVVDDGKANDGKSNNKNKDDDNMVGIITDKDIFRAIMKNQNLIPSLLADELFSVHKTIYEQFSEYWFGDILHKR